LFINAHPVAVFDNFNEFRKFFEYFFCVAAQVNWGDSFSK
jgi:hypothetical protein